MRIIEMLNETLGVEFFQWLIPSSTILYLVAFAVPTLVFVKRLPPKGLSRFDTALMLTLLGLGALVGAKLFFVAVHLRAHLLMPSHVFSMNGSFSWGTYLGVSAVALAYCRFKGIPSLPFLAALFSCLPLATSIGRWACFMNGDDFGVTTDVPWGVRYPWGSFPHAHHVQLGMIPVTEQLSAPVHANQLYLSAGALYLFFIVSEIWRKLPGLPEVTIAAFLVLYGAQRFVLDSFREEADLSWLPGVNFSQFMCILVCTLGVLLLIANKKTITEMFVRRIYQKHGGLQE